MAYEGYESFFEVLFKKNKEKKEELNEKEQIKESIKIDFILSLEIVLITLASVENEPFYKTIYRSSGSFIVNGFCNIWNCFIYC